MKYLTLLLFLSLSALLPAQSYCDYDKLYREGKTFAKKRQYKMALYKFNSARRCDPSKGEPVDAAIEALLNQIEGEKKTADRERERAEAAKKVADQERERAEEEKKAAEEAKKTANLEKERAERTLEELKEATGRIVDNILRDADNSIYRLDYEVALEKIKSAMVFGVEQQKVSDALLELVFWYAETGRIARAQGVLDTAARLLGRESDIAPLAAQVLSDSTQARRFLRDAIRRLNPRRDSFLQERYFPVIVMVKGGEFQMGSENGKKNERPLHSVQLSSFRIARAETTWWQYKLFSTATGKNNIPWKPTGWGGEGDNPVINVRWHDAVAYANWLNRREGVEPAVKEDGDETYILNLQSASYRLPTEAEWEYAAQSGTAFDVTAYVGGNDINEVAWYYENCGGRTRPVMQKKSNRIGLYDMSGNVWEWCWDWFDTYKVGTFKNPTGPVSGSIRVVRGGSWGHDPDDCGLLSRYGWNPKDRHNDVGFRVARTD